MDSIRSVLVSSIGRCAGRVRPPDRDEETPSGASGIDAPQVSAQRPATTSPAAESPRGFRGRSAHVNRANGVRTISTLGRRPTPGANHFLVRSWPFLALSNRSTRRPAQRTPAQQMHVQVGHALPAVPPVVDHQPIPRGFETEAPGDFRRLQNQMANQRVVDGTGLRDPRDGLAGNHQHAHRAMADECPEKPPRDRPRKRCPPGSAGPRSSRTGSSRQVLGRSRTRHQSAHRAEFPRLTHAGKGEPLQKSLAPRRQETRRTRSGKACLLLRVFSYLRSRASARPACPGRRPRGSPAKQAACPANRLPSRPRRRPTPVGRGPIAWWCSLSRLPPDPGRRSWFPRRHHPPDPGAAGVATPSSRSGAARGHDAGRSRGPRVGPWDRSRVGPPAG